MTLVEYHEVVETFATDRTNHALDVSVLPWGAGAVITSVIPIASTPRRKAEPYDASRSRSRWRGTVSHGKACVTWRESQTVVGCSVTAMRTIFLQSWARRSSRRAAETTQTPLRMCRWQRCPRPDRAGSYARSDKVYLVFAPCTSRRLLG